ncbi:hypothetical protein FBU59_006482 [Linderina macrospora]|uniref:Uncharacterized protein n=1 Tax=Linderina macrospora TaxID=4868 RepID=A0ACC1IZR0_9FUNG|nr:hypothetical protein FBU59_006482 [Linderina macrospora]
MKITWTPVRRFPEGAAYHILEQSKVGQIPHVYLSGILVKEFCGHRMEFLIIEDCGKSPLQIFAGKSSSLTGEKASTLVSMIRQVSSCLVWVRCAGILHRDISMGNIAIRQGDKSKGCVASIIDFGYAKLLPNDIAEGVLREVSAKWSFEPKTVSYTEDSLDAITGTPMYMSIPILFGKKQRGLHDDIESLFYVVLHLIWELQMPASENRTVPAPLNFLGSENMAFVRAGTLGSKTGYLRSFGIRECPDELRRVLDAMYDYLFIDGDGKNIACCFNEDWCTRKSHDTDAAALFMDLEASCQQVSAAYKCTSRGENIC